MQRTVVASALAIGLALAARSASAHHLACQQTVNGGQLVHVNKFPAQLKYELTIINTINDRDSTALSVSDSVLHDLGFDWTPAAPFDVEEGQSVTRSFTVDVKNKHQCREIAGLDGDKDQFIDNVFSVTWDHGSAACTTRVVCGEGGGGGECTGDDCVCKDEKGLKHGLGFWKNHPAAVAACMSKGSIDLGTLTITTEAQAMGVLWGSPAKYADGTTRTNLDHARFLLQRRLLVATCNVRVLGAQWLEANEAAEEVAIIKGTSCRADRTEHPELKKGEFCEMDPQKKWGKGDSSGKNAVDPTPKSGQTCSDGDNCEDHGANCGGEDGDAGE